MGNVVGVTGHVQLLEPGPFGFAPTGLGSLYHENPTQVPHKAIGLP